MCNVYLDLTDVPDELRDDLIQLLGVPSGHCHMFLENKLVAVERAGQRYAFSWMPNDSEGHDWFKSHGYKRLYWGDYAD